MTLGEIFFLLPESRLMLVQREETKHDGLLLRVENQYAPRKSHVSAVNMRRLFVNCQRSLSC